MPNNTDSFPFITSENNVGSVSFNIYWSSAMSFKSLKLQEELKRCNSSLESSEISSAAVRPVLQDDGLSESPDTNMYSQEKWGK